MTNCCDISNPLIRDGASQSKRQVEALPPDFVKVDEKDFADFLVFAYQLSKQIIYYKANTHPLDDQPDPTDNQSHGDWQGFFDSYTPVQIALITKTSSQSFRNAYNRNLDKFLLDRTPKNLAPLLLTLKSKFNQIFDWHGHIKTYPPLASYIKGLFKSNLRNPFLRLWAFDRAYSIETGESLFGTKLDVFCKDLNDAFQLNIDINLPPAPDQTPLKGTTFEARTEIDAVFQVLFQNYRQIIQKTQNSNYLTDSLKAQQDYPPHLALYFAFWDVLKPARDDLNRMTQRHLDFFYRDVLLLPEKAVKPDRAHLIFELAKFQQDYKLDRGTAFKAGKDASNVELLYKLDEEIVVHKAQIADIKGLFLDSKETGLGKPINFKGLHISPIANSANGQGAEFPKDQVVKAWQPFGDATRPEAAIGLVIASNLLLLQEGNRTITIKLDLQEKPSNQVESATPKLADLVTPNANDLKRLFKVKVSGAKDWIVASIQSVGKITSTSNGITTHQLTLTARIVIAQPAIVPCHADLKQPSLPTIQKSVLLLQVNNDDSSTLSSYHFLRSFEVTKLSLTVAVDAVHNLIVQNDLSVLDVNKPFQPFGFQPKVGSNFYIGSQEIFQKPLSKLSINFDLEKTPPRKSNSSQDLNWLDIYAAYGIDATFNLGQLKVWALRQKVWKLDNSNNKVNLFNAQPLVLDSVLENLNLKTFIDLEPIESWTPQTQNGFLRLQLIGDSFLHDRYATVLARQVLASATSELIPISNATGGGTSLKRKAVIGAIYRLSDKSLFIGGSDNLYYVEPTAEPLIPQEPYTPVITSLSLSYEATADYILPNKTDRNQQPYIQLFHLYPFDGFKDITQSLPVSLLPTFLDEGTLYIGIQDLKAPTALPLLFQVAEETANTDLLKAGVQWSYLANNTWQPFQQHQIVSDRTNGLITSGIVDLAIPADITMGNTLLDPNYYWIKVAVAERSGAICSIIGVHTQAAQVTFSDQGNDSNHLAKPLSAEAIAKLLDPQPEIKTIEQPYNSFGGQGKESPTHYYTRISEHLRHKGRAVTIFDYERLVLERFPEIYKVRCINHSGINDRISVQERDNLQELVPGSVTLAIIPDLSQRSSSNDLEPKVNINLLDEIKKYLTNLSSSWVDIRVVNPRYEPIQVEFQMKLRNPYDANFDYYQRELQQSIIGFLSPWTQGSSTTEINFGGKVYRSSILNFVEEQPYVDYVLDFQMRQGNQRNLREVIASSSRSILVSVPFISNTNGSQIGHLITQVTSDPPDLSTNPDELGYLPLNLLTLE